MTAIMIGVISCSPTDIKLLITLFVSRLLNNYC